MAHIIDGMELTDKEFRAYTKESQYYTKLGWFEEFASGCRMSKWAEAGKIPPKGDVVITDNGTTYMFSNGHLHNDAGPAIAGANNNFWFVNGVIHNERGPAMVCKTRTKSYVLYVVNGRLHRADGPAYIVTGEEPDSFWLHAQQFTEAEHAAFIAKLALHGKTL